MKPWGKVKVRYHSEAAVLEAASMAFKTSTGNLSVHTTEADVVGWDSFGFLDLILALEAEYDFELQPADLADVTSLGDLARLIDAHGANTFSSARTEV